MRKSLLACLLAPLLALPVTLPAAAPPRLKVSENHRFLVTEDGKPFFYLGDTGWELFHRLNREEAEVYLKDRAGKRFTVIQAVVLAEFDGLTEPNAYGHKALIDNDPTKPNDDYFADVDWTVNKAESLGLYVGMLPTWGDKVNKKWGAGPVVFTPQNAGPYGEFLGRRYKDKPIIWILGGDRPVENDTHRAIWDAMAAGIRRGDGGSHLITMHPMGGSSSSQWFQDTKWLDFNMLQSGHGKRDIANYDMIAKDYAKQPTKPVIDGEPRYEDHPINWKPQNGWFDAHDVRQAEYWALFAGAAGHTYGCHDIWQFFDASRHPPVSSARTPWREALKLPASGQVQYGRALLESRPYLTRVPDQSLIASPNGEGPDHAQATRDADGTYAMVYVPSGKPVKVDLTKLKGASLKGWWFNPRDGSSKEVGTFKSEVTEFTPPADGEAGKRDWVLVVDDAAKDYPPPGGSR